MNIQTKAAIAATGLIALFAYLAPFRQQAVYANECVSHYIELAVEDFGKSPGTVGGADYWKGVEADAYRYCQGN